jgi:hypothetical protein
MNAPDIVLHAAAPVLRTEIEHLEVIPQRQDYFRSWRFWLVSDGCLPPTDVHVADRGARAVLIRREDGLAPLVEVEPVTLGDADRAIAYSRWFVTITSHPTAVIDDVGQIIGPIPAAIDRLEVEVVPPVAVPDARGGWRVSLFVHELDWLDRGLLRIGPDGRVDADFERVAEGLSIFGAWE